MLLEQQNTSLHPPTPCRCAPGWFNHKKSSVHIGGPEKAVKSLSGLPLRESCTAFINLSVLMVVSLYVLEAVGIVHKSGFPRGCNTRQYNTRQATDFHLPAHRLSLFEKKLSYMSLKLWNYLPEDLKEQCKGVQD
ncbi:hypothetical protein J6590_060851 [Homalodisca vitripennis]|nr:hypothetical protein J6590_060851 [Homalodisca vitripennis]